MGLSLLQTASSHDRDLGSDPLGLTFHPGPGHWGFRGSPHGSVPKLVTGPGLTTDTGEDQTTVVRQGPASAGQHSAGGFRAKTGHTVLVLKIDPGKDQA